MCGSLFHDVDMIVITIVAACLMQRIFIIEKQKITIYDPSNGSAMYNVLIKRVRKL